MILKQCVEIDGKGFGEGVPGLILEAEPWDPFSYMLMI